MEEELCQDLVSNDEERLNSFREIRKGAVAFGHYQKRLFVMMGFYWITASFFLILPFYFFKMPVYCSNPQTNSDSECLPCDQTCQNAICQAQPTTIKNFIKFEHTLTYDFGFFCGSQFWRMFYKISTQSMSFVGLLLYGYIGDVKGRKLAYKISWRFYTIGLVFFTFTNTPFLISFGYFIACINCFASLVIQFVLLFEQISPSIRVFACYLLLAFLLIGPLLTSFLANYLVELGRTWTLAILCTGPSIILSLVTGYVEQSALFVYKNSKLHAFNILNKIAKTNGSPPFIIDLSKSSWRKIDFYQPTLSDMLQHQLMRGKLAVGVFFGFALYYCRRMSQIQLDPITDQYLRGTLMNATSSVATLTIIVLFSRFKLNNFRFITFMLPILVLVDLTVTAIGVNGYWFQTVITIVVRYVADLSYSVFVIWAIQSYPTVCRTKCVGFVFTGSALGSVAAYGLRSVPLAQLAVGLGISILVFVFSSKIRLDYQHRLMDTLSSKAYDGQDQFKRV